VAIVLKTDNPNQIDKPRIIYVKPDETCQICGNPRLSLTEEKSRDVYAYHYINKIATSFDTQKAVDVIIRAVSSPTSFMIGALTASFDVDPKPSVFRLIARSGNNENITQDQVGLVNKAMSRGKKDWAAANNNVPTSYQGVNYGGLGNWTTAYGKPVQIPVQAFSDAGISDADIRGYLQGRSCSAMKLLLCLGQIVPPKLWKDAKDITVNMTEEFYRAQDSKSSEDIRNGRKRGEWSYLSDSCRWCRVRFQYLLCNAPKRQANQRRRQNRR
jgi:hypothetical protein